MRNRLAHRHDGRPIYAIGDVHGAIGLLRRLEGAIVAESDGDPAAGRASAQPLVVMLGDLIDRGPHSAQVLDHVAAGHPRFERICLAGNHEIACADYLAGRAPWRVWEAHGGTSTLMSFGIDPCLHEGRPDALREAARQAFGPRRIDFLETLPTLLRVGRTLFVHAGIRPGVPLEEQSDTDLTTIREDFFEVSGRQPFWVVHGHTPVELPHTGDRRINIDTQAWASGRLTALRIASGGSGFLTT